MVIAQSNIGMDGALSAGNGISAGEVGAGERGGRKGNSPVCEVKNRISVGAI